MLLSVGLGGMISMFVRMNGMRARCMGMMRRLFMIARLVMLGCFRMMFRCLGVMVSGGFVVVTCLFGHELTPVMETDNTDSMCRTQSRIVIQSSCQHLYCRST